MQSLFRSVLMRLCELQQMDDECRFGAGFKAVSQPVQHKDRDCS